MDKYFKELWSITFGKKPEEYKGIYFFNRLKSFFNLSILFFEKIVSNYGTSYGHVLFWMFIVNFLFYYHNSFVWRQIEWLNDNFECVVGFSRFFANKVIPFKENIGIRGFVQLVINGVLVYELIKSFRKFSRKL